MTAFPLVESLEATPRFELGIRALQAPALPLGHVADRGAGVRRITSSVKEGWPSGPTHRTLPTSLREYLERTTGFEPATPTLARLCSTN